MMTMTHDIDSITAADIETWARVERALSGKTRAVLHGAGRPTNDRVVRGQLPDRRDIRLASGGRG